MSIETAATKSVKEKDANKSTIFSIDNIMFLMMLIMSIVIGCSVGFYEVYRSRNMLTLNPICDTGYCYYLNVTSLETKNTEGLNTFAALYNKLCYLKSIGVQLLILDQINLTHSDPEYSKYLRKTLVKARKDGITVYMDIKPDSYNLAVNYVNMGVLGFVSMQPFCATPTTEGCATKGLRSVNDLLKKTQVPINGLLIYLPEKAEVQKTLDTDSNFNYTIVPIGNKPKKQVDKFIYSPSIDYMKTNTKENLNGRLLILAKLLVQPKFLIYGGFELDGKTSDIFTNPEPIKNTYLTNLMIEFHAFRQTDNEFQQSKAADITPTTTAKFSVYKRIYTEGAAKSTDFYSFVVIDSTVTKFQFKSLITENSDKKLTIVFAFSPVNENTKLVNKIITADEEIGIDKLILLVVKAE